MNTDNKISNGIAVPKESSEKLTYTVVEVSNLLQIGKTKAYELCNQGIFRTVKIGKAVRILKTSFDDWLNNQMN